MFSLARLLTDVKTKILPVKSDKLWEGVFWDLNLVEVLNRALQSPMHQLQEDGASFRTNLGD